jgi:hypothetical protein
MHSQEEMDPLLFSLNELWLKYEVITQEILRYPWKLVCIIIDSKDKFKFFLTPNNLLQVQKLTP